MPASGKGCQSCAGDCCSHVSFVSTHTPRGAFSIDLSYATLRALGYEELQRPHPPYAHKTRDGCAVYETRPLLCRTYYCRGKLWRPR